MRIVYDLTIDDLAAHSLFQVTHLPTVKNLMYRSIIIMSFLCLLPAALLSYAARHPLPMVVGAIIVVTFNVVYPRSFRRTVTRNSKRIYMDNRGRGILGVREVRIENDGLLTRSEFGENKAYWPGIESVDETDDYWFITFNVASALPIPKARVLEGDVEAFMTEVEKRWLAARDNANPE